LVGGWVAIEGEQSRFADSVDRTLCCWVTGKVRHWDAPAKVSGVSTRVG